MKLESKPTEENSSVSTPKLTQAEFLAILYEERAKIVAAQGSDQLSTAAIDVLRDPDRAYASSLYIKLETLPKAISATRK